MKILYFVAQYTGFTREFFAFKILSRFTAHAVVFSHLHPHGKCVSRFRCSSYILCCCPSHPEHSTQDAHHDASRHAVSLHAGYVPVVRRTALSPSSRSKQFLG